MAERRFDDDEVTEILRLATAGETPVPVVQQATGLTLAELQEIGEAVGIPPERMAGAAQALTVRSGVPLPAPILGIPRAVGRTVPLPEGFSDEGWDRLVVLLRETFGGAGEIVVQGALRSWRFRDVEIHVEPASGGDRLRLTARKGDAVAYLTLGGFLVVFGVGLLLLTILTGEPLAARIASGFVTATGVGQISWGRWQLPRWRGLRERQFDRIASEVGQGASR